jgi:hypothetical protein
MRMYRSMMQKSNVYTSNIGRKSDRKFRVYSRVLLRCSYSSTYFVPQRQALKSSFDTCPIHCSELPSFAVVSVVAMPVFVVAAVAVVASQASRKQSTRLDSPASAV